MKLHELAIVASLVPIAEQCLLRDLLGDGLLLGLLGAEGALPNPTFLISSRFTLALKCGIRSLHQGKVSGSNRDNLRTLWLVVLIFFSCVIAALAGPSSAVLMIPRVGWFFNSNDSYSSAERSTIPTILIGTAPGLLDDALFNESNMFALPADIVGSGFRYWKDVAGYELQSPRMSQQEKSKHQFHDYYGQVYINTSGTIHRPLEGAWTGSTTVTTATRINYDLHFVNSMTLPRLDILEKWTRIKIIDSTHGFIGSATCRAGQQISCDESSRPTGNSTLPGNSTYPNWCYRSVDAENSVGEMRTGRNLLMAKDFVEGVTDPRIWVTEGPRIDENIHYSDSIELLFERRPEDELEPILTVCSYSAAHVAAEGTSYGTGEMASAVRFFDHVITADGTTAPPRKIPIP